MSVSLMSHYSHETMPDLSPDTMSSVYPDRPIRPLPKRRLRERLSPDVAESIEYPPAPKTTTPLFYYPYGLKEEGGGGAVAQPDSTHPSERERADEAERNYISRRNGEEIDSEEDEVAAYRAHLSGRPGSDKSSRAFRYVQRPESARYANPKAPASTTSSADGYDSFENSNNKKKRKIPTPGDVGLNGVHLSTDLAGMGLSPPSDEILSREEATQAQYYSSGGSTASALGLSGPGRGRYGRVRSGRSPLRTLSDVSNNWTNGRLPKPRQAQWPVANESTGIISNAIANAEKLPISPARGQENISFLQQQTPKKSSPTTTQFTFSCDSQVPGTVPWPGPDPATTKVNQSPAARGMATHSTQTDPNMPAGQAAKQGPATSQPAAGAQRDSAPQQPAPAKKNRRRTGKEYLVAARHRREQQEYQNYHNPVPPENEWICEFCEYERIFGTPPEALIRQYEIKDRKLRKQEAERRRLLEKAKMKGRKGKKGNKTNPKAAPVPQDRAAQALAPPAPQAPSATQSQSQGTQSEAEHNDYEDDYEVDEDGYLPEDTSPEGIASAERRRVAHPEEFESPPRSVAGYDNPAPAAVATDTPA